jgi:hypothetical protein
MWSADECMSNVLGGCFRSILENPEVADEQVRLTCEKLTAQHRLVDGKSQNYADLLATWVEDMEGPLDLQNCTMFGVWFPPADLLAMIPS